jgi:hypothetical protein
MSHTDDELTALRAEVHELRREVEVLRGQTGACAGSERSTTRRGMLRLAGAAAAGVGASLLGRSPAAADNGLVNTNPALTTTLTHTGQTGFHFRSSDSTFPTNAEVVQVSAGSTNRHCVRAFANNGTSAIFVRNDGIGSAILATAQGLGPAVTISNTQGAVLSLSRSLGKVRPNLRTDEFQPSGSLDVDGEGNLWYCIAPSSAAQPGTWQKLGGPTVAGAFHAISPIRAYDSRKAAYTPNGKRAPNSSFVMSVSDAHDLSTGAVTQTNVVPAGAAAVAYNLAAIATEGANFLAVTSADEATFASATLTWATGGQTVTVGSISPVNADRQVKVFCGSGTGGAHVAVDIVGYWL